MMGAMEWATAPVVFLYNKEMMDARKYKGLIDFSGLAW